MCSAFFSASEMSFSACNKVRLEHESDNGNKKASVAFKIAEKFWSISPLPLWAPSP